MLCELFAFGCLCQRGSLLYRYLIQAGTQIGGGMILNPQRPAVVAYIQGLFDQATILILFLSAAISRLQVERVSALEIDFFLSARQLKSTNT